MLSANQNQTKVKYFFNKTTDRPRLYNAEEHGDTKITQSITMTKQHMYARTMQQPTSLKLTRQNPVVKIYYCC